MSCTCHLFIKMEWRFYNAMKKTMQSAHNALHEFALAGGKIHEQTLI